MGLLNYTTRANLVAKTPENIADVTDCLDKIRTSVNSVAEEQLEAALATKINAIIETQIGSALATRLALGPGGRGKCVIAASEARANTAFGTLTTPDQITGIVMPTDGLVLVGYEAQVKETVADAARAAIFLGSNQTVAPAQSSTSPVAIAARSNAGVAGAFFPVVSCPSGLVAGTPVDGSTNTGFATTGQALAIGSTVTRGEANTTSLAGPAFAGGFCVIEAAAGTYTVSVQYRATSGTVTAQNRKLWVLAIGF